MKMKTHIFKHNKKPLKQLFKRFLVRLEKVVNIAYNIYINEKEGNST